MRNETPLARRAATALAYVTTGWLGLRLALPPGLATAVWPPSGMAVAAAWAWGPEVWPGIAAGSAALNYCLLAGGGRGRAAIVAAIVAAGSTLQALVAARALRSVLGAPRAFLRPGEVFGFAAIVAACCTIAATFGTAALWGSGLAAGASLAANWVTWWLGDVVGILVLVPAFWSMRGGEPWTRKKRVEAAALAAVTAGLALLLFWPGSWIARERLPAAYILLPVVALVSVEFGQRGASAVVTGTAIAAILGTIGGVGPFSRALDGLSPLLMQGFVGVLSLTSLLLAAATEQERGVQRDLERRVEERTAELTRSNADLEQFAYACSHDLKEPLRKITGFIELFARRYSGKLDPQADEMIGFVVGGAERMQRLIRDLLEYSRVSHQEEPEQQVDLAELLAGVVADLGDTIRAGGAVVEHGALPSVRGNRAQLRQLFENLLSNALKFRGSRAPCVAVSSRREGGEWVISFADNGIGIAPEYLERVFGLFRRLHAPEAFPGTGVGLALCKRIVQRHGGRIWVESSPEGSTFRFTLPAR